MIGRAPIAAVTRNAGQPAAAALQLSASRRVELRVCRRLTRPGGRRRWGRGRCGWAATLRRPERACRPPTGRAAIVRAANGPSRDTTSRQARGGFFIFIFF